MRDMRPQSLMSHILKHKYKKKTHKQKKQTIMIPIVKQYHQNPIFFKNFYNDEYCGGKMETYKQKVNITEDENAFLLDIAAPGYSREEIQVSINADELLISSNHKEDEKQTEQKYLRQEYKKEAFARRFKIPKNIEADKIEAKHNNGILSISLPKRAKIEIPVQEIEVK